MPWVFETRYRKWAQHPPIFEALHNYGGVANMTSWTRAFAPSTLGPTLSKNSESSSPQATGRRKRERAYVASSNRVAFKTTSMRSLDHTIELEQGTKPPALVPYCMAPPELEELRKQLKDLLDVGYVRLSRALSSAPVLFQKKKRMDRYEYASIIDRSTRSPSITSI